METRYERQEQFREIGTKGQNILKKKTVLIIGIGALGSTSSELLCRAGIGKLILVDDDKVELSNLQRQSLFSEKDIKKSKAKSAKKRLNEINQDVKIEIYENRLTKSNINLIKKAMPDIVLDCSDNLETRFLINEFCTNNNIPWVFCTVAGSRGFAKLIYKNACFNCIFEKNKIGQTGNEVGIINSVVNFASSIQVTEAIKFLLNKKTEDNLIYFDVWTLNLEKIKVKRQKNCKICGK